MDAAVVGGRVAEYPVEAMFLERWSPRAMSGEEVGREQLFSLFEAARWAPSSFNNQPWRFLYARRRTPDWEVFCDLLVPGNRVWAQRAGALIVVVSHRLFEANGAPSRTHHYDAGAAWAYLALQGSRMGLVVHGMEGFDYEKARKVLWVPDDFDVEAMAAVGRPGRKADLPPKLRAIEEPNTRKRVAELAFEGGFKPRG